MPPQNNPEPQTPTPTPSETPQLPPEPQNTQPPVPNPGQAPTPEQALVAVAKKSMPKIAKFALIGFGIFSVLMAIFIFAVIKLTNNATADAVVVSDQLVNSIQADDASGVYALTSATYQSSTSESDTEQLVNGISSALQGEEKVTGKIAQTDNGTNYAAIVYSIDNKAYIRVVLEKDGSGWKVLNFRSSQTPLEAIIE